MPQLPIADYGLIGDMRTAALVSRHGSIDWCCLPRFDSGSLFAALLDPERGGSWEITPLDDGFTTRQQYRDGTNILETIFRTDDGEVQLVDFMPVGVDGRPSAEHPEIHRQVSCTGGGVSLRIRFMPRFEYASRTTRLEVLRGGLYATDRVAQVVTLSCTRNLDWTVEQGAAVATLPLREGESEWLVLRYDDDDIHPVNEYESAEKMEITGAFWRVWTSRVRYVGPWRKQVERSALALKLLTHAESGAIIAAPTTSLPETLGGSRNWDYRFVWLRDAAFTLAALERVGHAAEADQFMRFLKRVTRHEGGGHLQIMYGVDGQRDLVERQLDHLAGYAGSKPVRVGNGAADQLQIDVYGEVLETAEMWRRNHPMTDGTWRVLRPLVDWVSRNWHRPDSSIWEVRGEVRHYTYSKLMSWVALDRGIRMAEELRLDGDVEKWRTERDLLRAEILERGWSSRKQAFIQAYESPETLDASTLAVGFVDFLPWSDPRMQSTVKAIAAELTSPDGNMVYRYRSPDGLEGEEGAFSICTFWLAEALLRSGDRDGADRIFRGMLERANHLGLYSEEIDPVTGEFLGNFPQGFTHIALINCAVAFARKAQREAPRS
ncbi:MAG: glycoside hydrolase family 15 protein [Gemmatimonadales bacterium]